MLVSSGATLVGPVIIGRAIDTYVRLKDSHGLLLSSVLLLAVYLVGVIASYTQIRTMGGVGRRVLFSLRNELFAKLQDLPLAFFTENKAGDLISRVNNDTDKLNQFVAQALMQFVSSLFLMTGVAVFVLSLNFRLGIAALLPAIGVFAVTKATGAWVKRRNMRSMQTLGGLSAEVQESLQNFKVIVAFNRLEYFQRKFKSCQRYQLHRFRIGRFRQQHIYANVRLCAQPGDAPGGGVRHYSDRSDGNHGRPPDRIFALRQQFLWADAATGNRVVVLPARAGGARSHLRSARARVRHAGIGRGSGPNPLPFSNSATSTSNIPAARKFCTTSRLSWRKERCMRWSARPEAGRPPRRRSWHAFTIPPRDRFSSTAATSARFAPAERARKIGVIPQEPFLFTGTVGDNIVYGNEDYANCSTGQLAAVLEKSNLSSLLSRFPEGLETKVASSGNGISLGQKQLIAFMRATLRSPELLILDEATANIDTVTEQLLEEILAKLPAQTTKVIIAHRLNTIDKVDQIFFVNSGAIALAGSMEHALEMLLHEKRAS